MTGHGPGAKWPTVKIAGFFQELWTPGFGTPVGSIHDFSAATRCHDESEIFEYLRAGHEVFTVMGAAVDVLDPEQQFLSRDSLLTDGEWMWRADLWHYVRLHRVRLPNEFNSEPFPTSGWKRLDDGDPLHAETVAEPGADRVTG
jgi:hypothetical protein